MLTDTKCRNAKPAGKPYKLADGKGLYLEVKPNGVKAWRYRFELSREGARKESLFAIGNYANAPAGETEAQTAHSDDRDHLFRSIATSVAWVLVAPLDVDGDVSLLWVGQARQEAVPVVDRRDPRATRSAHTADAAARAGGPC